MATAPVGFCTPRSSMVGTLLDDIVAGLPFDDIKRKFAAKMHPLQYMRPQAAPAAGAIAQAEKIVAEMGVAPAFERRFARLEDLEVLWSPAGDTPPSGGAGVFGHLQAKGTTPAAPLNIPAQPITWDKFARTVLPKARRIDVYMASRMNLSAMVTAQDMDAPPIIQWDTPERRNPVSSYVYHGGSQPELWELKSGTWAPVTAITLFPHLWGANQTFTHQGRGAFLILKGARDTQKGGLALFPEILKSELHPVRAVVEAHSNSRQLHGREEASACGLAIGEKGGTDSIRVTTDIGTACYRIDRWD